jgi:hypothetical protein
MMVALFGINYPFVEGILKAVVVIGSRRDIGTTAHRTRVIVNNIVAVVGRFAPSLLYASRAS